MALQNRQSPSGPLLPSAGASELALIQTMSVAAIADACSTAAGVQDNGAVFAALTYVPQAIEVVSMRTYIMNGTVANANMRMVIYDEDLQLLGQTEIGPMDTQGFINLQLESPISLLGGQTIFMGIWVDNNGPTFGGEEGVFAESDLHFLVADIPAPVEDASSLRGSSSENIWVAALPA